MRKGRSMSVPYARRIRERAERTVGGEARGEGGDAKCPGSGRGTAREGEAGVAEGAAGGGTRGRGGSCREGGTRRRGRGGKRSAESAAGDRHGDPVEAGTGGAEGPAREVRRSRDRRRRADGRGSAGEGRAGTSEQRGGKGQARGEREGAGAAGDAQDVWRAGQRARGLPRPWDVARGNRGAVARPRHPLMGTARAAPTTLVSVPACRFEPRWAP